MAAGRPRMFCTEKALDSAMQIFWRKGYEGASMVDLTAAIGINSPSLYAAFGSKEGLFKAVLERYDQRRAEFMQAILDSPTAKEVAHMYLHGIADFCADTGGNNPPGCLYMQSGGGCGDAAVSDEVARHRAEKEAALTARFERAKRDGDLPETTDPKTLAKYITAMGNGMALQASGGATVKELHAVADMALASAASTLSR